MKSVVALLALAACTHATATVNPNAHAPAPVARARDTSVYLPVAPRNLYRAPMGANPLDGKRIALTAFVPPANDKLAQIYAGSLFWASMPLVHVSGNAPPPGDDFELVTVYGTYSQGDIVVDRWERAR
jgi:hypothetical protein